jgi:uncharacterized membrane protein YkvA (DUF1232 family)
VAPTGHTGVAWGRGVAIVWGEGMARLGRKEKMDALWSSMTGQQGGPPLGQRLTAFPRLVRETFAGRYDGKGRLAAIVAGLAYIISPIDLIPEAVFLVFGLADDAVVAVIIAKLILNETERFLIWERSRAGSLGDRYARR